MSRINRSTIDMHDQKAEIERAIATGVKASRVASMYGVSVDALKRHRTKMPPQLIAALRGEQLKPGADLQRLREEESANLLANLAHHRVRLLEMFDKAISGDESQHAARFSREIHRNLELVGKYLGEFAHHQVKIQQNIILAPEWLQLRAVLLRTLTGPQYSHARDAVVECFESIERQSTTPDPKTIAAEFNHVVAGLATEPADASRP